MSKIFTPARMAEAMKPVMLFLLLMLLSLQNNAQGTWVPLNRAAPHYNEGVMLLLTNGTVLCKTSSGGTGYGMKWDKLTPDIHGSYVNGTWTTIASMADERLYFSTQVLPDGRVYVAGGEYGSGGTKGEVYNPVTNTWTPTQQIVSTHAISDANSEILPNGKVLQAVVDTASTRLNFLWDPATNTYAHTGSCLRVDNEGAWIKLPDNSTLFVDNYSTTSERYIPATNTWINDAVAPVNLYDPYGSEAGGAFLLPDGRIWFIGSTPTSAYYTPSGSTAMGTWAAGPAIPFSQGAPDAASCIMPNGKILLAVSQTPTAANHFPDSTVFYVFDYTTNTYTRIQAPGITGDTIIQSAFITNMLSLPDGSVLFANQGDDQYYEFVPDSGPLAAGKPTVDNIFRVSCDTFKATGKLFNGITEGASYGDDWQMSTNYPIIRLTSGTNVYYATTYNWNRIGAVQTGSLPDTTTFVLPAGLPVGTYTLELVANGNPSAGITINTSMAVSPATSAICQSGSVTLSDIWGGGVWSTSGSAIATIDPVSGMASGTGGGTAVITYKLGACSATATVGVTPVTMAITAAGSTNICTGATTALTDATTGGTWSSSNASVAAVNSSGQVMGSSQGSATISYSNGCGIATQNIITNAAPALIAGSATVCISGGTTTLSNSSTGGVWSSNNTLVATVDPLTGVVTAGAGGGSAVIFYSNGCGTDAALTIGIGTAPAVPAPITGGLVICAGLTTALSDITAGGVWSSTNMGVATISPTGSVTAISSGSAVISYAVSNICGSTSATTIVTVNPLPSPAAISGPLASFCEGTSVILSDATPGGTWSSNIPGIASVSSSGVVTGLSGGSTTIQYTVTNICGTVSATYVISVDPLPAVSSITGMTSICVGTVLLLNDGTTGGTWSSSTPGIATVNSGGVVTALNPGNATILYSVTNICGTTHVTASVPVITVPSPGVITGTDSVCTGRMISLTDAVPGGVWTTDYGVIANINILGQVIGNTAGYDTIRYSVANICGSAMAVRRIRVIDASSPECIATGTSLVKSTDAALKVYPNPNTGTFTVLLSSPGNEPVTVTVINVVGETVKEISTMTNKNTDVKLNVAAGIYSVSARTAQSVYNVTVVVER